MSLTRGNFILKCDEKTCSTEIDLGTTNFEDAKEIAKDYKDENGWTTLRRGERYADICGDH